MINSHEATETSFKAAHLLMKNKKAFSDDEVMKEAMIIMANNAFKDQALCAKVTGFDHVMMRLYTASALKTKDFQGAIGGAVS